MDLRDAISVSKAAILVNIALAGIKTIAGLIGHSTALVADGIESMTDVCSTLIVLGGLHLAQKPADPKHPFGHGKAEPIAGLIVLALLLSSAGMIAFQSIQEIRHPSRPPEAFTLAILIIVVLVKEKLFQKAVKAGAKSGSTSLRADAWHHRSDAITSAAAFVGILLSIVGGPGFEAAEDWAALISCGVILWSAVTVLRDLLDQFMDASVDPKILEEVRRIAEKVSGVEGIEKCRVRRTGLNLLMDIHVLVNGNLSVRDGHEIAHKVKDALVGSEHQIADVVVHIEPGS